MTPHDELRKLAEAALQTFHDHEYNDPAPPFNFKVWSAFEYAFKPKTCIALLDEIAQLRAEVEPAKKDAARYRALRNLHDEKLDIAGIPCIALPQGGNTGFMANKEDADKAVDMLIAGHLVWREDFKEQTK